MSPLERELHEAAYQGDEKKITTLLQLGVNPNAYDEHKRTALGFASLNGHIAIVRILLQKGADPTITSDNGQTPLTLAQNSGYVGIAYMLENHQAQKPPVIVKSPVSSPLSLPASKNVGQFPSKEQLNKSLVAAAFVEDINEISVLIKSGANPDATDKDGYTALGWAAYRGNIKSVKELIKHKASVNFKDNYDRTALDQAASKDQVAVVKVLLKNGADPLIQDNDGWNVLTTSAYQGRVRIVKALLENGVDPDAIDGNGDTALQWASYKGHTEVVMILLSYNANLNSVDASGSTALHYAALNNHIEVLNILIDNEALIKIKNDDDMTALDIAVENEFSEIEEALVAAESFEEFTQSLEDFKPDQQSKQPQADSKSAVYTHDLLSQLRGMIGLDSVKNEVGQLINFLRVQQMRKEKALSTPEQSLHMVFTGNPGTGKTTIARLIAQIYKSMGILSEGQFIETDRAGLVGGFLGQTAIKTQKIAESAFGGVLFIDEAYSLTDDTHGRDMYGQEAVSTLLKLMEDHRDDLIVIVAGYTEPMQKFIRSNPGLQSRFNKFLHFDDYSPAELTEIFKHFAQQGDYKLHPATELKLGNVFTNLYQSRDETFGNARLARNMFEKAINAHANRMVAASAMDEESLVTLYPEDIPNS